MFTYDAVTPTSVTAGNATSYADIVLTTLVPAVDNTPVVAFTVLTPSAAGRGVFLQGANSTGNAVANLGQVTSVVLNSYNTVMCQLLAGVPTISYKVSNGSDAVAVNIASYQFFI
jgi:hypothetical protein